MGGRGGSSGIGSGKGLDVTTKDGQTTRYYFSNRNGTNYYQRGVSGTPQPTPMNMSAKEFKQRVESNGAITKSVSGSERIKEKKAYENYRKEMDDSLNRSSVSDKIMVSGSRADAKVNRANRRRRK